MYKAKFKEGTAQQGFLEGNQAPENSAQLPQETISQEAAMVPNQSPVQDRDLPQTSSFSSPPEAGQADSQCILGQGFKGKGPSISDTSIVCTEEWLSDQDAHSPEISDISEPEEELKRADSAAAESAKDLDLQLSEPSFMKVSKIQLAHILIA